MAVLFTILFLFVGTAMAAVAVRAAAAMFAGFPTAKLIAMPFREAAFLLIQQNTSTERPDALNWKLAPALYFALAAVAISVVPLAKGIVVADLQAGIVLWGACESLVVVAVFLQGWSANSPFPLIGAYRYAATGLSAMLISMFVLIGAALPAESLSVSAIVEAQRPVWNVVRQPLGLPLFIMLGLSLSLRGPFNYADAADLAGGTVSEVSGPSRLCWEVARLATLVSFSAMAASAFLGGYLGPVLPGIAWLILKSLLILIITIAAGHLFARTTPSRMMTFQWIVLLPLSFLGLAVAGLEALP